MSTYKQAVTKEVDKTEMLAHINHDWQALFKKQRLQLATSRSFVFIDFLSKAEITDLHWLTDDPDFDDWSISFLYKEKFYTFENYEEDDFFDCSHFFNDYELYSFINFLFELDIAYYLHGAFENTSI